MNIELSEKEVELIVHLLTKSMTENKNEKIGIKFSIDEVILLEKLEQSLKITDLEENNTGVKTKYLN
ncbi:MAG: hypothetical protein PHN29_07095 [Endomicrobiaceae bacterium]|jgi:hypothetical protein|nr:hypothetical protein [Endomicrobiaceae bacterium]